MSNKKTYSFPVVRYRNGVPVTFFKNQVVFAEQHEKMIKELTTRAEKAENELIELRKDKERLDWLDKDSNQARSAKSRMAFSPEDLSRMVIDEEKKGLIT